MYKQLSSVQKKKNVCFVMVFGFCMLGVYRDKFIYQFLVMCILSVRTDKQFDIKKRIKANN